MAQIDSTFALLDVKKGRRKLAKRIAAAPVPVTIKGRLVNVWGRDDGVSIEFEVEVDSVETPPNPHPTAPA